MARVVLTDDAREDLRDLDRAAQVLVLKALKKLESEPDKRGAALGSKAGGNLTGFRKLVVGDRDYRVVYRVDPDGTVCVVWVIGKRADDEVYKMAVARLKMNSDHELAKELGDLVDATFAPRRR